MPMVDQACALPNTSRDASAIQRDFYVVEFHHARVTQTPAFTEAVKVSD
jgi:hypothetical protein